MTRPVVTLYSVSRSDVPPIVEWCNDTFGERGHWSTPMEKKPWYMRIGPGRLDREFSFRTEADAVLFTLRWK